MSSGLINNILNFIADRMVSKTLIWENSSPTTGFAPTTILSGQDLTIYDSIEVIGVNYTGYTSVMPSVTIPRGGHGNMIGLAGSSGDSAGTGYLVARGLRFNDNSITISEARGVATNSTSWATNNNNMIPLKIYGVKHLGESISS